MKDFNNSISIVVFISDWCPVCLEYKIILNKFQSDYDINIDYSKKMDSLCSVIPTTIFFINDRKYIIEGFVNYDQLVEYYKNIISDSCDPIIA